MAVGVSVIDVVALETDAVYVVDPDAKLGSRVPDEITRLDNDETVAAAVRVIVIVYVEVVEPSWAVDKTLIVFAPTLRARDPEATAEVSET